MTVTRHPDRHGDRTPPAARPPPTKPLQADLFDVADREETGRALIEQLIADTRLYTDAKAAYEMLDFVARLRAVAPFNAMLLHIQKPYVTHVATAADWEGRFRRQPKAGARPLIVLRTYGPVDFVFDFQDTEGDPLPEDAFSFPTLGEVSEPRMASLLHNARRDRFEVSLRDEGDASAGRIRVKERSKAPKGRHLYEVGLNRNHSRATQLVTLAHELGHALLGHLGADPGRRVPDRHDRDHALREVEAEAVAYLVARRNGLRPRSENYLKSFEGAFAELDWHAVMRAANAIETVLGISANQYWNQAATTSVTSASR